MSNQSQIIFKPSILRTFLGLVYMLILVAAIFYLIVIVPKIFIHEPIQWNLLGQSLSFSIPFTLLILFIPWYSYNSITVFDAEIEGPTMYGMFWRKIKIPVNSLIVKDVGHDFLYSRILLGHVLSSINGDKINILWLEKKKIDELLALIESKARS